MVVEFILSIVGCFIGAFLGDCFYYKWFNKKPSKIDDDLIDKYIEVSDKSIIELRLKEYDWKSFVEEIDENPSLISKLNKINSNKKYHIGIGDYNKRSLCELFYYSEQVWLIGLHNDWLSTSLEGANWKKEQYIKPIKALRYFNLIQICQAIEEGYCET